MSLGALRKVLRKFAFIIALCATGCGGGIDCPIDTPDCCYNVLFGCGFFDLPSGCSCDHYGLSYQGAAAAFTKPRAVPSRGMNGNWSGALQKSQSSSPSFLNRVSGMVAVKEQGNRVTVTVPGYGKLRGLKSSKGYTVSGQYGSFLSTCKSTVRASFIKSRAGSGTLQIGVNYNCGRSSCSAQYRGTIQQW